MLNPIDAQHTKWSDPGTYRTFLGELSSKPASIADALQHVMIHPVVAHARGIAVPATASKDRNLRNVARLLEEAVQRDHRSFSHERSPADYLYCTCRDFALLAVSVLREQGIPARLRVGFASYFRPGNWEDHWICEYRIGHHWAVFDSQLSEDARRGLGISFDVSDVPETGWRSAGSTWRALRSGEVDPNICGVSFVGIKGDWFVAASVLRDAAALVGVEGILPWDYWGPGRAFSATHHVTGQQAREIDALSATLEPAPLDRSGAEAALAVFPWALPTGTFLSFSVNRQGTEVAI